MYHKILTELKHLIIDDSNTDVGISVGVQR